MRTSGTRFHFSSIAHDNSALESSEDIISTPFPLPSSVVSPYVPSNSTAADSITHLYATLEGSQVVSKFNLPASEADLVKIFLAVIRVDLPEPSSAAPSVDGQSKTRGADITIVMYVPLGKAAEVRNRNGELSGEVRELEVRAKGWFAQAVRDFKIVDYGLFA